MKTKLQWLDTKYKGKFIRSLDIDPTKPNKLNKEELYTDQEKKKLKPDDDYKTICVENNEQAKKIVNFIGKNYACKLKETLLNDNCLYNSVLEQISRHCQRYTSSLLRKPAAFYLASYPEVFASQMRALVDKPLESYILSQFHRYAYGDYLILGVIAIMWNLKITIITPELEDIKVFHKSETPHILIVYNGRDSLEGHYTATG